MKIQDLFENWGLRGIKIKAGFAEMEWEPQEEEKQAAWELYIELLTRVATQPLSDEEGDEEAAIASVYKLFPVTRELLKTRGRKAQTFSRIAIIILNQKIRPFTAIWHRYHADGTLTDSLSRQDCRDDLMILQKILRNYAGMLAEIAGVEDLQDLDQDAMIEIGR